MLAFTIDLYVPYLLAGNPYLTGRYSVTGIHVSDGLVLMFLCPYACQRGIYDRCLSLGCN